MRGDLLPSSRLHPPIDILGVVHDFRDGAVETEKAVRKVERVAGLGERAHSAHEVWPAATDHDIKRRDAVLTEMFAQCVAYRTERLVDVGVVGFAADDEEYVGLLEP